MKPFNERKFWLLLLTGLWLGLVLGLSFIETPLKFQAPGITRELGLGIGRLVFGTLNKIELGLWLVISVLVLPFFRKTEAKKMFLVAYAILTGILAVQTFHLLPVLDLRAEQIIAGNKPDPSWHHTGFIVIELIKLPVLVVLLAAVYRHRLD